MKIRLGYRAMILLLPRLLPRAHRLLLSRKGKTGLPSLLQAFSVEKAGVFLDVEKILTESVPRLVREKLAVHGPVSYLAKTEIGIAIDISGHPFRYRIVNGETFHVGDSMQGAPLIRLSVSLADLEKLIIPENIVLLFPKKDGNIQRKYDLLSRLKGHARLIVLNKDGSTSVIVIELNGRDIPLAVFKMGWDDFRQMVGQRIPPFQLFMSGRLKIEGDTMFAMTLQPLFA